MIGLITCGSHAQSAGERWTDAELLGDAAAGNGVRMAGTKKRCVSFNRLGGYLIWVCLAHHESSDVLGAESLESFLVRSLLLEVLEVTSFGFVSLIMTRACDGGRGSDVLGADGRGLCMSLFVACRRDLPGGLMCKRDAQGLRAFFPWEHF
jgi:hypothetical protein